MPVVAFCKQQRRAGPQQPPEYGVSSPAPSTSDALCSRRVLRRQQPQGHAICRAENKLSAVVDDDPPPVTLCGVAEFGGIERYTYRPYRCDCAYACGLTLLVTLPVTQWCFYIGSLGY